MRSLTDEQWDRYFALVDRLGRLPAIERADAICALRGRDEYAGLLTLATLNGQLAPDFDRCRSGERIRNYLLKEPIGSGGMGVVYRAVQRFADGIERDVAVKLMHPRLLASDPERAPGRFRAEISALAKLEHPGIARIYDGGVHRDPESREETLFLAMELVVGEAVDAYVARRRSTLGVPGILQLFLRVCDAVHHAHRHDVVHRDLKPANILVDAAGMPRVIDFGLARRAGASVGRDPPCIASGTPAYMSPEQLRGEHAAPAAAGDVYALGLILAELVLGEPCVTAVPGDPPPSPSVDVASRLAAVAGSDLAGVVARATSPLPAARYDSVRALSEPLARCLEAVGARRDAFDRYRRLLLEELHDFWVRGVLESSVGATASIRLDLELCPEAVSNPWTPIVQANPAARLELSPGSGIGEVFRDTGEALLILGAAGAGKTTLLLELARELARRVEQDDSLPVPVVFHLSTWADKRMPLRDWLVDELDKRYGVPPGAGRACLAHDQLVLLLDGLDEVAPAQRARCALELSAFRAANRRARIAVCSRTADYEALPERLALRAAVLIRPLTPAQVEDYLVREGPRLGGVRDALRADPQLRELLCTPLLLGIATLACGAGLAGSAADPCSLEQRRARLFASYTEAMFTRRARDASYTTEQSVRWLGWLASALLQHHESVLYLEWMQPRWLPGRLARWIVSDGSVIFCALLVGLAVSLFGTVASDVPFSLPATLALSLVGGVAFARLGYGDRIRPVTRLAWSRSTLGRQLARKLSVALGVGALLAVGVAFAFEADVGLAIGTGTTLAFCYFGGLDLDSADAPAPRPTTPNEGIVRSARNALYGAAVGATAGAVAGALTTGLSGTLLCALVFALILSYITGAHPCLQHLLLRFFLWRGDCAPWRYARFLEFAVGRIFLHRVGGGYTFVHRSVLEHFATIRASSSPSGIGAAKQPVGGGVPPSA